MKSSLIYLGGAPECCTFIGEISKDNVNYLTLKTVIP